MRSLRYTILAVALMACDGSRIETMKRVAELEAISAQKDSLLRDVTATSAFLADLSAQVNTVRNLQAGRRASGGTDLEDNLTPAERRTMLLGQVREITQRLNETERRLADSRRRIVELTGSDAEKSRRLAGFDSTIASFRELVESQKTQITALHEQVNALAAENTQLRADNARLVTQTSALSYTRDSLTTERNTVYYVAGTQDELVRLGVVEKVGGFLGLGTTPVAARDLNPSAFTAIDMTKVTDIALPRPGREYRVVSRHDLSALQGGEPSNGRIKDAIRIRDPQAFWAASRYLIVVER